MVVFAPLGWHWFPANTLRDSNFLTTNTKVYSFLYIFRCWGVRVQFLKITPFHATGLRNRKYWGPWVMMGPTPCRLSHWKCLSRKYAYWDVWMTDWAENQNMHTESPRERCQRPRRSDGRCSGCDYRREDGLRPWTGRSTIVKKNTGSNGISQVVRPGSHCTHTNQ